MPPSPLSPFLPSESDVVEGWNSRLGSTLRPDGEMPEDALSAGLAAAIRDPETSWTGQRLLAVCQGQAPTPAVRRAAMVRALDLVGAAARAAPARPGFPSAGETFRRAARELAELALRAGRGLYDAELHATGAQLLERDLHLSDLWLRRAPDAGHPALQASGGAAYLPLARGLLLEPARHAVVDLDAARHLALQLLDGYTATEALEGAGDLAGVVAQVIGTGGAPNAVPAAQVGLRAGWPEVVAPSVARIRQDWHLTGRPGPTFEPLDQTTAPRLLRALAVARTPDVGADRPPPSAAQQAAAQQATEVLRAAGQGGSRRHLAPVAEALLRATQGAPDAVQDAAAAEVALWMPTARLKASVESWTGARDAAARHDGAWGQAETRAWILEGMAEGRVRGSGFVADLGPRGRWQALVALTATGPQAPATAALVGFLEALCDLPAPALVDVGARATAGQRRAFLAQVLDHAHRPARALGLRLAGAWAAPDPGRPAAASTEPAHRPRRGR